MSLHTSYSSCCSLLLSMAYCISESILLIKAPLLSPGACLNSGAGFTGLVIPCSNFSSEKLRQALQ